MKRFEIQLTLFVLYKLQTCHLRTISNCSLIVSNRLCNSQETLNVIHATCILVI